VGATESIIVAILSGAVSIIGLVIQQVNSRRNRRDDAAKRQSEAPDRAVERLSQALDRAEKQAEAYATRLAKLEDESAVLRTQYQSSLSTNDSLMEENRTLRRERDEARLQCNRGKTT
jgi:chromosome segregation ATPase